MSAHGKIYIKSCHTSEEYDMILSDLLTEASALRKYDG